MKNIGEGAFSVVYLAEDLFLKRKIALKVMKSQTLSYSFEDREAFEREVKILTELNHPYIIEIYDYGESRGTYYIAMELAETDLNKLIKTKGRKIDSKILEYTFIQICRALAEAHKHKILHRDIKPSNILYTSKYIAKLADFSVAKLVSEEQYTTYITQSTKSSPTLVGTPGYIAPEVVNNITKYTQTHTLGKSRKYIEKTDIYTEKADIYSLGVTFYEAFTGTLPKHEYHSIRIFRRNIPKILDETLKTMLSPEPDDRPTAERILKDLGLDPEILKDTSAHELKYMIEAKKSEVKGLLLSKLQEIEDYLSQVQSLATSDSSKIRRIERTVRKVERIIDDLFETTQLTSKIEFPLNIFILDYLTYKQEVLKNILKEGLS